MSSSYRSAICSSNGMHREAGHRDDRKRDRGADRVGRHGSGRQGAWPLRPAAALALAAAGCIPAGAAPAQDRTLPDPPRLHFDVSAGLEHSDNPDFVAHPSTGATWARTDLGFGVIDETPVSTLSFSGGLTARSTLAGTGSGGSGTDNGIQSRNLALSYGREGADSDLTLKLAAEEARLAFIRPLSDFIDANGQVVLPDGGLAVLSGTGWRRTLRFDGKLTMGKEGPVQTTLSAGATSVHYRDTSNVYDDYRRSHADLDFALALNPVVKATAGVGIRTYDDSTRNDRTVSTRAGLVLDRPDGSYGAQLTFDDAPGGHRIGASLSRGMERPWGKLDARLGATRDVNGGTYVTGALNLNWDMEDGKLGLSLQRGLRSGEQNAEEVRTALALNYSQPLTPRTGLSLGVDYAASSPTGSGTAASTRVESVNLGVSYALTQNWGLRTGLNYHRTDQSGTDPLKETTVTVNLGRSFDIGF